MAENIWFQPEYIECHVFTMLNIFTFAKFLQTKEISKEKLHKFPSYRGIEPHSCGLRPVTAQGSCSSDIH